MPDFLSRAGLWAGLTLASALLAGIIHRLGLPAATLLGPMVAGVVFALRGARLTVPRWGFLFAQAVLGTLVARSVTVAVLETFLIDWPVMGLAIATIVLSGALMGFLLMLLGSLPGSTAAWGSSPGGATVMTALAEAHGADIRMVAFMQYLRLFVVVVTASGVSRLLLGQPVALPDAGWGLGLDAPVIPVLETLAIVIGGSVAARWLRFPSAPLLLPLLAGVALNSTGMVHLTLPPWLVAATYFLLGWYIGLRFTGPMVRYALRSVPQILAAVTGLILLCVGAAWMLTRWMGVDWLTAYLATSPGGLDTVIAIALSSRCDVPFVLCLQTVRLFAVILLAPVAARFIARYAEQRDGKQNTPE